MAGRELEARTCGKCDSANTRRIGGSIEPHLDYIECRDCGYITVVLVPSSSSSVTAGGSARSKHGTTAPGSNIEVVISGITNDHVRASIEEAVRAVFVRRPTNEPWKVVVAPADTRGRWNISVAMPARRHIALMTVPIGRLADTVSAYLRRMIIGIEALETTHRTHIR